MQKLPHVPLSSGDMTETRRLPDFPSTPLKDANKAYDTESHLFNSELREGGAKYHEAVTSPSRLLRSTSPRQAEAQPQGSTPTPRQVAFAESELAQSTNVGDLSPISRPSFSTGMLGPSKVSPLAPEQLGLGLLRALPSHKDPLHEHRLCVHEHTKAWVHDGREREAIDRLSTSTSQMRCSQSYERRE